MLALTLLRKFVFIKGVVCQTEGNTCNKTTSNVTGPAYLCQGSNFCKLWHILQCKWFSGRSDKPALAVFTCTKVC